MTVSVVIGTVVLAVLAAAIAVVDANRRATAPARTVVVTITVETSRFAKAMINAEIAAAAVGQSFTLASARMEELGRVLWLDAYERTKNWSAPADPNPFPRLRLWWRP
jgi:hypothetical protein